MNDTTPLDNFFAGFYEWDMLKVIYLIQQAILSIVGPAFIYIVIAYETSQNHRLLPNQLLSHLFMANLVRLFTARILYLIGIFFGPLSDWFCESVVHSNRFFFLLFFTHLALWQGVKCLQRFKPRYILTIDDDFFATFLTEASVLFNGLHVIFAHMIGMQYDDIDYHICTGRSHRENMDIFNQFFSRFGKNQNSSSAETFQEKTLFATFLTVLFTLLLISAALIHLSSLKDSLCLKVAVQGHLEASTDSMIGAGGSFLVIVLVVVLIIPSFIAADYAKSDPQSINDGHGKVWTYISRITVTILTQGIVPIIILVGNPNLRKFSRKKMKELFQTIKNYTTKCF